MLDYECSCVCGVSVIYACEFCVFFFFKQKTAYEMRISDWSSDVCSSDLASGEPATSKQKALLSYLGIKFASDLSKDQAASLVNDAMEDPKHTARVAQDRKSVV